MKEDKIKRIHGVPIPLWEKLGLKELPPAQCEFSVGDRVIFTNEYGLKFDMDVAGFSKDDSFYGKFIHLVSHGSDGSGNAWWFPHSLEEIILHSLDTGKD